MWRLGLVVLAIAGVGVGVHFAREYQDEHDRAEDVETEKYNRRLKVDPSDLQCNPPGPGKSVETAMQHAVNATGVRAFVYLMDREHRDVFVVDTSVGSQTCDDSLLHKLDASAEVMNLIRKCKIKTLACKDTSAAIGW